MSGVAKCYGRPFRQALIRRRATPGRLIEINLDHCALAAALGLLAGFLLWF